MDDAEDTTVIAAQAHINGELAFDGEAKVIGIVEGKITAKGGLHVDERGICKAQIEVDNILVDGSIEGDVTAKQRVQLNSAGKIIGNVVAEKLITAEGASIVGHVKIGADPSSSVEARVSTQTVEKEPLTTLNDSIESPEPTPASTY